MTVQVPVPVQPPPLQPVNVEPAAGVAVKVTAVPLANAAEQVAPQEMPAGALETVPVPAPAFVTVSVKGCRVNVAVTDVAALIVTVQVPVPVQPPPLQPVNVEPAAGVAVRVTAVPLAKAAEQVAPQEMPAGALVTVPLPAPALRHGEREGLQGERRGDRRGRAHRDGAGAGAGAAAAAPAGERRAGGRRRRSR